jgi:hypothetical protein
MSNICAVANNPVEHLLVCDAINRFGRLVDDRAWDGLAALCADRVELDYTAMFAGQPRVVDAAEIGGIWAARLRGFDGTQHVITNTVTEFDGDTATAVSNVVAMHVLTELGANGTLSGGGTYRMRLVRGDGRWLIAGIKADVTWLLGNKDLFTAAANRAADVTS